MIQKELNTEVRIRNIFDKKRNKYGYGKTLKMEIIKGR